MPLSQSSEIDHIRLDLFPDVWFSYFRKHGYRIGYYEYSGVKGLLRWYATDKDGKKVTNEYWTAAMAAHALAGNIK